MHVLHNISISLLYAKAHQHLSFKSFSIPLDLLALELQSMGRASGGILLFAGLYEKS